MQPSTTHPTPEMSAKAPRGTAMIVDDEATNRRLLGAVLVREGFHCLHAADGEEALAIFTQQTPDIIFMDVMMPGIDGYETTRRIREVLCGRFIPIIFLTALSDEQSLVRCIEAGGDDFISKPFNLAILKARIASMERVRDLYRHLESQHVELSQRYSREQQEQALAERIFSHVVGTRNVAVESLGFLQRAADTFCGDLILTAHLPDGGLRILVADFTGHGLAAAIGAMPVAEIFHAMSAKGVDDLLLLAELNRKLHTLLPADRFMAACLVSIPADLHELRLWNGGMPPALLVTAQGLQEFHAKALPLGILAEPPEKDSLMQIPLKGGERLLLMSDGVLEAVDAQERLFVDTTFDGLKQALASKEAMLPALIHALDQHCGHTVQSDDITALEIPIGTDLINLPEKHERHHAPPPGQGSWHWSLELCDSYLGAMSSLQGALGSLKLLDGLEPHIGALEIIISELYTNALEHGVLGLDSAMKSTSNGFELYYTERAKRLQQGVKGCVFIELIYEPVAAGGCVKIRLRDSGPGFAVTQGGFPAQNLNQTPDAKRPWGRGITLVRSLCESIHYNQQGNEVEAVYRW